MGQVASKAARYDMSTIAARPEIRLALIVNGEPTTTVATTLAELLGEVGFAGLKVATAVNGDFVAERRRVDIRLRGGDKIEIVAPRQGG